MNFKRVAALLLAGAMVMTAVPVYAKGDDDCQYHEDSS